MQSNEQLAALQDIKKMMERSSRFISLSGLSGVAAGLCALVGAWLGWRELEQFRIAQGAYSGAGAVLELEKKLITIASGVFLSALVLAFLFTYRRAKKNNLSVWDITARRLMINTIIPLAAGGLFIMGMMYHGVTAFVGPACLVFYGLALVNGSKYTLGEIRYIGYGEIILGLLNMWMLGYSLAFWTIGFGFLHIFYGIVMWFKYDRN
ncbi:MAG: hypothetical protein EOO04_32565 [Chitinophagaceae bacterium]|nr:MAG: hypothetical protein EOO04_32565 [Chitinophagaceae bacterium]